jgi:hypothetical protein
VQFLIDAGERVRPEYLPTGMDDVDAVLGEVGVSQQRKAGAISLDERLFNRSRYGDNVDVLLFDVSA